jgi:RHS repeat-associated protein
VTTNGIETTFTYDAFNRRLSKNNLLFFYHNENEIGSYQNQVQELRVLGQGYGAEIGAAVLYELNQKTYIPLHDHLGNVVVLINAGQAQETHRYSAFGIELTQTSLNPWRFCSKRFDAETNLTYFGRRYYDTTIGRWITTDPAGYQDGPNLYAYVHNNPLSKHDLYGLLDEDGFSFSSFGRSVYRQGYSFLDSWTRGVELAFTNPQNQITANLIGASWMIDTFPEDQEMIYNHAY